MPLPRMAFISAKRAWPISCRIAALAMSGWAGLMLST
jgi:hypothetical protein